MCIRDRNTYDFSLSFDVEKYDDANAEELQGIFGSSIIVQFTDEMCIRDSRWVDPQLFDLIHAPENLIFKIKKVLMDLIRFFHISFNAFGRDRRTFSVSHSCTIPICI